jgi:hypothetical protein
MIFRRVILLIVFVTLNILSCKSKKAVNSIEQKAAVYNNKIQGKWVLEDDSLNVLLFDNNSIIQSTEIGKDTFTYKLSKDCNSSIINKKIELNKWQVCLEWYKSGELELVDIIQTLDDSVLSLNSPINNQFAVYRKK